MTSSPVRSQLSLRTLFRPGAESCTDVEFDAKELTCEISVDARAEPGGPSQPNQIPIVRIVVGMLVGEEDVT